MSTKSDNKFYYVGLKAFIERRGKILILKEASAGDFIGGKWELPGGRIQHTEDEVPLEQILLREVTEECGEIDLTIGEIVHAFRRPFDHDHSWVFLIGYDCTSSHGEIILSEEHADFAWIDETEIENFEFVYGYKEALQKYFASKKR